MIPIDVIRWMRCYAKRERGSVRIQELRIIGPLSRDPPPVRLIASIQSAPCAHNARSYQPHKSNCWRQALSITMPLDVPDNRPKTLVAAETRNFFLAPSIRSSVWQSTGEQGGRQFPTLAHTLIEQCTRQHSKATHKKVRSTEHRIAQPSAQQWRAKIQSMPEKQFERGARKTKNETKRQEKF